jgi:hypothetical protein
MLVVESLERLRVPKLGSLDELDFFRVVFLALSLWVGQVAFSGRTS